jgi:hypothetical protein
VVSREVARVWRHAHAPCCGCSCCGWSISGQTQETSSFCEGDPDVGSHYGKNVRALPGGADGLVAWATSG